MRVAIGALAFVFIACHSVYVPNGRNSPMFSEGGELQLSAALATGDYASGLSGRNLDLDFQTALSLTDHLGVMGNFSITDAGHHVRYPSLYRHHWFAEGGIGYYNNIGKTCFEFFSGFGKGYGRSTFEDQCSAPTIGVETNYNRVFFQPAVGWKRSYLHLSLVSRFSVVHFSRYGEIQEPATVFFFEPAVSGKCNLMNNRLYFQWQGGMSFSAGDLYPGNCLDDVPVNISFGVGGRIGCGRKKSDLPGR